MTALLVRSLMEDGGLETALRTALKGKNSKITMTYFIYETSF